MTEAALVWSLVAGGLTLPGTGIEIRMGEHPDMPFTLRCPHQQPLSYWTLNSAKADGERCAREIAIFRRPDQA